MSVPNEINSAMNNPKEINDSKEIGSAKKINTSTSLDELHSTNPVKEVNVWDGATRLFHWTLVILILGAWYTIENRMIDTHEIIGHCLIALLVFRVIWGVIGSSTARFSHFIKNPLAALSYLKGSLSLKKEHATGHNPAGGWMVVVMLLVIGAQVVTGLFSNNDLGFSGALADSVTKSMSDTLTQLHALNFTVIVAIVWLHVVAVFFYVIVKNDNLFKAMITGKKPVNQINPSDKISFAPLYQAIIAFSLSSALGYWLMI
ncbi:MAG: cytochrome b/b6 domain-containing protein [Thalassotalea sp.]